MDLTGREIDKYRIVRKLGQGGMADVYLAVDTKIGREVAIKIIRTEVFAPVELERVLRRFRQEAVALASLNHPNIIQVNDYGDHDGKPYLVMPYLPGGTLKDRLTGPMDWREAFKLLLPIISAVAYAHKNDILHRDIKPTNILIHNDNTPVITDFGVAKILTDPDASISMTLAGIGTPNYMAPEQWKGKAEYASDQYSIGVVLYKMITGQLPYSAETPSEVMIKVVVDPLPPALSIISNLPMHVDDLLNKMLMKEPGSRFESVEVVKSHMIDLLENNTGMVAVTEKKEPKRRAAEKPPQIQKIDKWRLLNIWNGHNATIRSIAFSPDSKRIVSSANDNTVKIFDVRSGELLESIEGHTFGVTSVAYSPDGRKVVSGSNDKTIKIWDADSGNLVNTLEGHEEMIRSVAYSPDGGQIVSGSNDGSVKVWNAETGELLLTFTGHNLFVTTVAFSKDGTRIASGSTDNTVIIWEAETGEVMKILEGHTSWIRSIAFSPDGCWIVGGAWDGVTNIWDLGSGALLEKLDGQSSWLTSVAYSPDGRWIASGFENGMVKIWDAGTMVLMDTLERNTGSITSIAFSPDSAWIASGSVNGWINLWSI